MKYRVFFLLHISHFLRHILAKIRTQVFTYFDLLHKCRHPNNYNTNNILIYYVLNNIRVIFFLGLCAWVINIMKFNNVWQVVEPKRKARDKANNELNAARNKLAELRNMINVTYSLYVNICTVSHYLWFIVLGIRKKTTDFNR